MPTPFLWIKAECWILDALKREVAYSTGYWILDIQKK